MDEPTKQFVGIVAQTLPIAEPVYEFGSLQVAGQEGFADLRPLFPGKKYIGADMREGPGVDVILDLHDIALPSESVGAAIIVGTLEHVEFPRKAIKEAHRILKPGGILIITSVMNFPIHAHPSDYWRFTPEGFKSLLQPFDSHYVDFAGEIDFPHTIVGVGCKGFSQEDSLEELAIRIKPWKEMWFNRAGHDWRALITPFVPPIIAHLGMGRKVRSGLRAVSRGVNLWRGSKSPS